MIKSDSYLTHVFFIFMCALFASEPALAAGGLQSGTDAVTDIRIWGYGFVGACALAHMVWSVYQAYIGDAPWTGCLKSLAYAAIAGGCVLAAEWGYQRFLG